MIHICAGPDIRKSQEHARNQPACNDGHAYGSGWVSTWLKWFISNSTYVVSVLLIITLGLSYSLYQS